MSQTLQKQLRAHKEYIQRLAQENQLRYDNPEGRAALGALELGFTEKWIYLFELTQNALDVGATHVQITPLENAGVRFEHNGTQELTQDNVKSLSKAFLSTKGADSVGFMGIGFKSVYMRFLRVGVADKRWRFCFEIEEQIDPETQAQTLDLLGVVQPRWDDQLPQPSRGYTTLFLLTRPRSASDNLHQDFTHAFPEHEDTLLALMAWRGLQELTLGDTRWRLSRQDHTVQVQRNDEPAQCWYTLAHEYTPTSEAVRAFQEHRRIQVRRELTPNDYQAMRRPRHLLALVPLEAGTPRPVKKGRIYATLPTKASLCMGLHLQADWFLDLSRLGLRALDEDPWQQQIIQQIPHLLQAYLRWVAEVCHTPQQVERAFSALRRPQDRDGHTLSERMLEVPWRHQLARLLQKVSCAPVYKGGHDTLSFVQPGRALLLPQELAEVFADHPERRPDLLFDSSIWATQACGQDALDFFTWLGLLRHLDGPTLAQRWTVEHMKRWWRRLKLSADQKEETLRALWSALCKLQQHKDWSCINDLPCMLSEARTWLSPRALHWLDQTYPFPDEAGGETAMRWLAPYLPTAQQRMDSKWRRQLERDEDKTLYRWLKQRGKPVELLSCVRKAQQDMAQRDTAPRRAEVLDFGRWLLKRYRKDDPRTEEQRALTHILIQDQDTQKQLYLETTQALVAAPYHPSGALRCLMHEHKRAVCPDYIDPEQEGADPLSWCRFLEAQGVPGPLRVYEVHQGHVEHWQDDLQQEFLGQKKAWLTQAHGGELYEAHFAPPLPSSPDAPGLRRLHEWLYEHMDAWRGKHLRLIRYKNRGKKKKAGPNLAPWMTRLSQLPWVPCKDGQYRKASQVLIEFEEARPDVPVADKANREMLRLLESCGVPFGADLPPAPALQRLEFSAQVPLAELLKRLRAVREDSTLLHQESAELIRILRHLSLPTTQGAQTTWNRLVQNAGGPHRGTLDRHLCPLRDVAQELAQELKHPAWPIHPPEEATGAQALDCLHGLWRQVSAGTLDKLGHASRAMPAAWTYLVQDLPHDAVLHQRWNKLRPEIMLYLEEGRWSPLSPDITWNDISQDPHLREALTLPRVNLSYLPEQEDTRRTLLSLLGLTPLSQRMERRLFKEQAQETPQDQQARFQKLCALLYLRGQGPSRGQVYHFPQEPPPRLFLQRYKHLKVQLYDKHQGHTDTLQSEAAMDGTHTLAVKDKYFEEDAARILCAHFEVPASEGLDINKCLRRLDHPEDFTALVRSWVDTSLLKSKRSQDQDTFWRGFHQWMGTTTPSPATQDPAKAPDNKAPADPPDSHVTRQPTRDSSNKPSPDNSPAHNDPPRPRDQAGKRPGEAPSPKRKPPRRLRPGQIAPNRFRMLLSAKHEGERTSPHHISPKDDARSRALVLEYETHHGRRPQPTPSHNPGHDLESLEPETGITRRIEIKGLAALWDADATVGMTGRQVRDALKENDPQVTYWLYVIDGLQTNSPRLFAIKNPVAKARYFHLQASDWANLAQETAQLLPSPPNPEEAFTHPWQNLLEVLDEDWHPLFLALHDHNMPRPDQVHYDVQGEDQRNRNFQALGYWYKNNKRLYLLETADATPPDTANEAFFLLPEEMQPGTQNQVIAWLQQHTHT